MRMDIVQLVLFLTANVAVAAPAPVKQFVPTKDWQYIPEDVAIPGGLEIKMDLENGGRWARYPAKSLEASEYLADDRENSLALVSLSKADLTKLEDKAYDHDYGMDIIRDYGASLINLYTSNGPLSDHAGRILGICLRNNRDAIRSLFPVSEDLLPHLVMEKRPVMILSAIISTPEGLRLAHSYDCLRKVRESVPTGDFDESLARAIVSLVENLAVSAEKEEEMCEWAYVCTHSSSPSLKQLGSSIYAQKDDFANISCAHVIKQ